MTANNDGNDISVFFGTGDGAFGAATRFGLNGGQAPTGVTAADFDNNGRVDIATINRYSTNASTSVLLNNCLFRYFLPLIGR